MRLLTILFIFLQLSSFAQLPNFGWVKQFGNSDYTERAYSIAIDASNNIYSSGVFGGTADFDPGPGVFNVTSPYFSLYISKLNQDGNFVSVMTIDGQNGVGYARSDVNGLSVDNNGNLYISGYFFGTVDFDPGSGVFNMTATPTANLHTDFLVKLDPSGNFLWAKKFGETEISHGANITLDGAGNVYCSNYYKGIVDFDPSSNVYNLTSYWWPTGSGGYVNNMYVLKLDSNGDFVYAKSIGYGTQSIYGAAMKVDASGNVYSTGYFTATADFDPDPTNVYNMTSAGNFDMFILKLDQAGNFVWAQRVGNTGVEYGTGITLDNANNLLVSMNNGTIIKMTVNNSLIWLKQFTTTAGSSTVNSVRTDANNNVYTTGYYNNHTDFDPGSAVYTVLAHGGLDLFLSKLDSDGNFVWAAGIGNVLDENSLAGLVLDNANNVYIAGYFAGTTDFDPSSGTANLTSTPYGYEDPFVMKFGTNALTFACPSSFIPVNNSISCNSTSATTLSWTAAPLAVGYNVYFDTGSGPATTLVSTNQLAISYSTTQALSSGQYSWRVEAVNATGTSLSCTELTFFIEGNIVTNIDDYVFGSLRSVVGCATEGSTVTFNQPTITSGLISSPWEITKNITIKGLSSTNKPIININFKNMGLSAGIKIINGKTLTITDVDLNDIFNINIPSNSLIDINTGFLKFMGSTHLLKL